SLLILSRQLRTDPAPERSQRCCNPVHGCGGGGSRRAARGASRSARVAWQRGWLRQRPDADADLDNRRGSASVDGRSEGLRLSASGDCRSEADTGVSARSRCDRSGPPLHPGTGVRRQRRLWRHRQLPLLGTLGLQALRAALHQLHVTGCASARHVQLRWRGDDPRLQGRQHLSEDPQDLFMQVNTE
ncbi:unnamed protein product, partial [Urochloa humidicola]